MPRGDDVRRGRQNARERSHYRRRRHDRRRAAFSESVRTTTFDRLNKNNNYNVIRVIKCVLFHTHTRSGEKTFFDIKMKPLLLWQERRVLDKRVAQTAHGKKL